jgi:hypothetical protein
MALKKVHRLLVLINNIHADLNSPAATGPEQFVELTNRLISDYSRLQFSVSKCPFALFRKSFEPVFSFLLQFPLI